MCRQVLLFMVGAALWSGPARAAEAPVQFGDQNLKAAVEEALGVDDPTPTDMLGLTSLNCSQNWYSAVTITSLSGLEYAANLQVLGVRLHRISDISPLTGLGNLMSLDLSQNQISNVSPLAGLSQLSYLNLHGNKVSNVAPLGGLGSLSTLVLRLNAVSDISPLAGDANLCDLDISDNTVSDLTPLAGLSHLSSLTAWCDRITNLAPLAGLSNLRNLNVGGNQISNIAPLAGLTNLSSLDLETNWISDISPLCALMSLTRVDLRGNDLSPMAIDVYIPQIVANNPGVSISYDNFRQLTVSSTPGGSIVSPGKGVFTYDYGTPIRLEARADTGYEFAGWSGSLSTMENPLLFTMDQDYQVRASFTCLLDTLYVDAAAPEDPEPYNPAVGDPGENGTTDHPFDAIQEAIDVAKDGATIIVRPGIYRERVDLKGKKLHLEADDPAIPHRGPCATIDATDAGPAVRIPAECGTECGLSGFIITRGKGPLGGAISCIGASPTLRNCLIVGNRSTDANGAAAYFSQSRAVLTNCTFADNYGGSRGAALLLQDSDITVSNSILGGDGPGEMLCRGTSYVTIQYCCVHGGWPGLGNTDVDPLFAARGYWADSANTAEPLPPENPAAVWMAGDYHLKSQAGRWYTVSSMWLCDNATSPCIDAGNPARDVGAEPAPNGGIINLGAYGGTTQASKSSPAGP